MVGGPIHFINEARLELPQAQFTLKVLEEFVQGCKSKNFGEGASVSVSVDAGNQREPKYIRIRVSDR